MVFSVFQWSWTADPQTTLNPQPEFSKFAIDTLVKESDDFLLVKHIAANASGENAAIFKLRISSIREH